MDSIHKGVSIGPYVIESVLPEGLGGFAQVVVACRQVVKGGPVERVALKIAKVDDNFKGPPGTSLNDVALRNEVEILRNLLHPGIVRLYPLPLSGRGRAYYAGAVNLKGQPRYYCMEYLAGGSVELLIQARSALPVAFAAEVTAQVCLALDYIHTQRYAHLDVTTKNILLRYPPSSDVPPQAVLVDFGAAQKERLTAHTEAGTIAYLSPERLQELHGSSAPEIVLDNRAVDVYALGVSLYRMLTGRLPFSGSKSHITTAILSQTPTRPAEHNTELTRYPELDELVMRMLSKQPGQRPTAKEVFMQLDLVVPPPRFWLGSSTKVEPQGAARRWKPYTLALAAVAVLELGGLAVQGAMITDLRKTGLETPPAVIAVTPSPPPRATTSVPSPQPATLIWTPTPSRTPTPSATATRVIPTVTPMKTSTPAPTATRTPVPPTLTPTLAAVTRLVAPTLAAPTLPPTPAATTFERISPGNGQWMAGVVRLAWRCSRYPDTEGGEVFEVWIGKGNPSTPFGGGTTFTSSFSFTPPKENDDVYYWRVRTVKAGAATSDWSELWSFGWTD